MPAPTLSSMSFTAPMGYAGTRGNKTFDRDRTSFVRPNPNFESEKTVASLIRKFRRARIRNGARSRSAQPGHSLYSAMWKNGYAGGDCARSSVRFFPGLREEKTRENEGARDLDNRFCATHTAVCRLSAPHIHVRMYIHRVSAFYQRWNLRETTPRCCREGS